MIKDVFTLKKNSWHARLMKFTWNLDFFDFSYMCPYFWLTVFNMIIFPATFFCKVICIHIFTAFGDGMEALGDYLEAIADRNTERLAERMAADEAYRQAVINRAVRMGEGSFRLSKRFQAAWQKLMYRDEDLADMIRSEQNTIRNDYFAEERKRREKQEVREFKNRLRDAERRCKEEEEGILRIRRERERDERFAAIRHRRMIAAKKRIVAINRIIKPIGQVFIYLIAAAVVISIGYVVYLACKAAGDVEHETYSSIGKWIIYILLGIITLLIVFVGIAVLVKQYGYKVVRAFNCSDTVDRIGDGLAWFFEKCAIPFVLIGRFFRRIFRGVGSILGLIIQMFKNQCPAIDWKD